MREEDGVAVRMKFTIEGLDELQDLMRTKLPDATSKNVLRRTLMKLGEPLRRDAQARAPKKTGHLQTSIVDTTRLSAHQRQQFRPVDPNDVTVFVGAGPLPYAHMIEYGTSKMRPRPFMRPAWEAGKQAVVDGFKSTLWDEIQRAIDRRERKAAKKLAEGTR